MIRSKHTYVLKKKNNLKENYENKICKWIGSKIDMGDPTTCVYQLIYDENVNDDTKIIQYFIMNGLGLWIKVDSYVAHMFYAWSYSNNKAVPISIQEQ